MAKFIQVESIIGSMTLQSVLNRVENARDEMVKSLIEICKIPAVHPESGGDGESKRAEFLKGMIEKLGLPVRSVDAPDDRVSSGVRPNLLVEVEGEQKKRIWIVSHSDIVPEGDLESWETDPFDPVVKDGKVFGRGTEDNGQAVVASLYALWAVKEENEKTGLSCGLAIVADEETGSEKGIRYLLKQGIFDPDDLILVPDFSSPKGDEIEIAEKNILWLRVKTTGRQAHGSLPDKGINAHRAGATLMLRADKELHAKYDHKNDMFDVPVSSFEPTKKESNVPNINTIPGEDVFYFDCRILPDVSPADVKQMERTLADEVENEYKV
ncbi:MAG: M20 family metallo-hydrolase, partial [Thermoplasmata archaeon]